MIKPWALREQSLVHCPHSSPSPSMVHQIVKGQLRSHKLITFPKFYMMLDTSMDPGKHTRGLDLQQAFVHHLYSVTTVPPLPTVL